MGAFFMSLGFVLFASSLLAGGCGGGSRHEPFRAVAADNGRMAVAGRLSAIEKAGMAGASADFRSAGRLYGRFVLSHALGRLRVWPWEALHTGHPLRMDDERHPAGTGKMCRSPGIQTEERAGCPAADRQEHLPKRKEDSDVPAAGKETEKGRALAALPLFSCLWVWRLLGRNGIRRDGRAVFRPRGQGLYGKN